MMADMIVWNWPVGYDFGKLSVTLSVTLYAPWETTMVVLNSNQKLWI